eukprot:TRINITY_DN660_c0_g1_i1.p1 TRINITY_DN660_c0_g1~~TRINITY_DN660_c0_g1_i1.p1  ORF type:complete len:254 (+),score=52.85 TRINITY_DN660_c0_g1_i1:147-908(+)
MNHVANSFSVLTIEAEVDTELIAANAASEDGGDATKTDENKKKGIKSGKMMLPKNDTNDQPGQSLASEKYKLPLVWIDLEMTGLDVEVDRILEIACIITDGNLTKLLEGPDLVIRQTKECLDNMGEWCRNHHDTSGLTKRVLQSTINEQDAEKQVIEFLHKNIGMDTFHLAGNSVYVDLSFLKKYMPDLASHFSHVLVDVSSLKALCLRWYPKDNRRAPSKVNKHRALSDIKESIMELKFYKENIFKGPKSRH